MDSNIIPSVNYVDFLRYEILLAEINTWAIGMVGPSNFGIKYTAGRARPEEIVSFLKDALETRADEVAQWDIPTRILAEIEDMNLKSQYNFTAYPEGCPTHPSVSQHKWLKYINE
jgi:regulator of sirC expression with transglutaminase-like and TPR domain